MTYLNVGGTVIQKRLAVGESIKVDTDTRGRYHVVAFQHNKNKP
jgi:uncharacterized protein (AIM24 family)